MIINLPLGNVLLYISVAIIVAAAAVVVSVAVSAYECRKKADFNQLFFPVSFSLGMGSTWGSWRSEAEWLAGWLTGCCFFNVCFLIRLLFVVNVLTVVVLILFLLFVAGVRTT